jgi:hypothetical protein
VFVDGSWFHSDKESRIKFLGLASDAQRILAAGGAATTIITKRVSGVTQDVLWKTMEQVEPRVFVPLTVQLVLDIEQAIGDLDATAYAVAEAHRAAMLQSATPESYDYSTGWPAIYVSG